MLKLIVLALIVVILGGGGFFVYQGLVKRASESTTAPEPVNLEATTPKTTPETTKSTTEAQDACQVLVNGSADMPALYKEGISWGESSLQKFMVSLENSEVVKEGCLIESGSITFNDATRVRNYYISELQKKNWQNISSSDLPGEAGSDTWMKENNYLVVEISPTSTQWSLVKVFHSKT